MNGDLKENVIEWFTGDSMCTATFTQKKFINRMRRMSQTNGKLVEIVHENVDGSIVYRFPVKAIHLTIYNQKPPVTECEDLEEES